MNKTIIITIILLIPVFIFSNLRAPYYYDGSFSGNIKLKKDLKYVYLLHEKMIITAVKSTHKSPPVESFGMKITYTILNDTNNEIEIPVQFLGSNVKNAYISVNNRNVDFRESNEEKVKKEFIKKLIVHRNNFNPDIYLKPGGKNTDISILNDENIEFDFNSLKEMFFYRYKTDFNIIEFNLKLSPGENTIQINYNQYPFVNEVYPLRNRFHFERAFTGFDYLFYPAYSWNIHKNFKLNITITVPSHNKNIFGAKYKITGTSNLNFNKTYNKKNKTAVFTGEFNDFSHDIFTFLINWE